MPTRKEKKPAKKTENLQTVEDKQNKDIRFPVIGIGASAGGLAAFKAFFSGFPKNTHPGLAFILVQHLAPDHSSILADLIRKFTPMQVFEVKDGMKVAVNCVYIIPPGYDMGFLNYSLQLFEPSAPRGQRLPIDYFFRSLAQDLRERAIGIVLSGTGSDGTLGIRTIKGEGGMIIAQIPDSAEFDGMPRSVLATGLVDFELPPGEMAKALLAYVAHASKNLYTRSEAIKTPLLANAMKKIFILLRSQTGHDFSQYKKSTIERRIERRMAVHQIASPEIYVKYMQQTSPEVEALFRDLLIGVTNFFRDTEAFQALEEQAIPKLFAHKSPGAVIRVWCPGCFTGEEAYSMAILLLEYMEKLKQRFSLQIFASDIDDYAITTARAGLYPASIVSDVSPERLARFFTVDGDSYRIHKNIRDMMLFSNQNVISDPPFSKIDLISCRNLMIYLEATLQKDLIALFHYALNPGGLLFLGTSETTGQSDDLFSVLDRKSKLYQRKKNLYGAQRRLFGRFIPLMTARMDTTRRSPDAGTKYPIPVKLPLKLLTENALLQKVTPSGALVNRQGDILYMHGKAGMYLELGAGEVGLPNIVNMAREGLRGKMTMALRKAAEAKESLSYPLVRFKTNGHFSFVNLSIHPVATGHETEPAAPLEESLFLVVLEEAKPTEDAGAASPSDPPDPSMDVDTRITALKGELLSQEEYLQSANEELESSTEELKSANEEMQSINEELQSSNEELETSKEELQSLNEELLTVNTELQNKVEELSQSNNDMNNLLAGTGIGTVFVDHQLRIMRYTPTASKLINLIESDVGRPVGHVLSNLSGYDDLSADVKSVLNTLHPKEVEVQTDSGDAYLMHILPYRTMNNVIEGAVITFVNITELKKLNVDITELKKVQAALRKSQDRLKKLFVEAPLGIALIDSLTGHIHDVNPMCAKIAGRTMEEMAHMDWMTITDPDYAQEARENMARLKAGEINGFQMENRCLHPDGAAVWISMTITLVQVEDQTHPLHMCMVEDITERKQAEDTLQKANSQLRLATVVRDAYDAITVQDMEGRIIAWNPGAQRMYGWSEAEALEMNVRHRIPEELQKEALAKLHQFSQAEVLEPHLTRRLAKDGSIVEVSIISTALLNEAGQMYGIATTERAREK